MSSESMHPTDDALADLVAGRLGAAERAEVELHLAGCDRCARLHATLASMRALLHASRREDPAPAAFERAIRAAIVAEAAATSAEAAPTPERSPAVLEEPSRPSRRPRASSPAWWVLAAAVLVLAIGLAFWGRRGDALADLAALHAHARPAIVSTDPATLENTLAGRLPFRPRVLDLAMMGLVLRGGGEGSVDGEPAAWMVYESADGRLVCVMWRGRLEALPASDDVRRNESFVFRIYRRGAATIVAWQEGELVCALVGEGDPEAVVALAMAKAMPVS